MSDKPQFSETERTAQQRRESVNFAVGVTMSQGGISPALTALYKRYIAGEVDTEYIDVQLEKMYPTTRGDDPRYAPGQPTDRWYPDLDVPPNRPLRPVPGEKPKPAAYPLKNKSL